jgi:hypothetical protein
MYTQHRKIWKPNNFKIFGSNKTKGPKLNSQNWLWLPTLMLYLRYLCLLAHSGVQHILCLTHPMLPVSLDCPYLIAPSVFPNVYFPVSLDCPCLIALQYSLTFIFQFLWIVHVWLPLQYSPTFIQQDMCPIVTYMIFYRYVLWPDVWWNNVLASYQSRFYMYTTLS